jgi:hypothetical protein
VELRASIAPLTIATDSLNKQIQVPEGTAGDMVMTASGRTPYVLTYNGSTVLPVSTATNTAGRQIKLTGAAEMLVLATDR